MKRVLLGSMPENLAEFEQLKQKFSTTSPEDVCALFIAALHVLTRNKQDGYAAVNALRGPRPLSRYEEQFLWDRLYDKLYLPMVYCDGAAPGNDYTPAQPLTITVHDDPRPQDMQQGYMRCYIKTAGADSPRAVTLRQKGSTGEWFLWEYPAIVMGVRVPVSQDPWA